MFCLVCAVVSDSFETCVGDETVDSSERCCSEELDLVLNLVHIVARLVNMRLPLQSPAPRTHSSTHFADFGCCWHCSFASVLLLGSASRTARLLSLELHLVRSTRTRVTRPSLRSSCARPRMATVVCLSNPCRSWRTLQADSTISRRDASLWLLGWSALVPGVHSAKPGCALDSPESPRVRSLSCSCRHRWWSALLDRFTRLFDRPVCVTVEPSVVHHACAALAQAHRRRVHERRELLPRAARGNCLHSVRSLLPCAARVGVTCALSLCSVVLAGPGLHRLTVFRPLVPELKCFRSSLEWLTSETGSTSLSSESGVAFAKAFNASVKPSRRSRGLHVNPSSCQWC